MILDNQQKVLVKCKLQKTLKYLKENDIVDYTNIDLDELVDQDFQGIKLTVMMMFLCKEGLV